MTAETSTTAKPTQDERIMAALSHASIILPLTVLIVPVIIWVTQKTKSTFVTFQSIQAIAYHIVLILSGFFGMMCYVCSFFSMFFPIILSGPAQDSNAPPPLFFVFFFTPVGIMLFMFAGYFVLVVYGIVGAALTLQGKDFRYVIL